jgi:flavin-dependent dehydrogenase
MGQRQAITNTHAQPGKSSRLELEDGSRVAVIGGGPAGSFFCYFFLDMALRTGMNFHADVYEPRDFTGTGPAACNMCGGIVSETLVQYLAAEGINLPSTVVQRGLDSYVLHMDIGSVRLETPLHEMRIAAVHRASGPKGLKEIRWRSFDDFLLRLAVEKGARLIRERVSEVVMNGGRPEIRTKSGEPRAYDLLVVASGVNSKTVGAVEGAEPEYRPPGTVKTFICEYHLGEEAMGAHLGSSMHVFLLNIPGVEFAAAIPKGEYATVCLLGDKLDRDTLGTFLGAPEVRACMPPGWDAGEHCCRCAPRINVRGARRPFGDRIVVIGDSGVTRLYKDGIGAAYRTAKAAATTAVFQGVSAGDFGRHYWPVCKVIKNDNAIGKIIFGVTQLMMRMKLSRRAVFKMVVDEQKKEGRARSMSMVLWDMFTGSATYREIFGRTLRPKFLVNVFWYVAISIFSGLFRRRG